MLARYSSDPLEAVGFDAMDFGEKESAMFEQRFLHMISVVDLVFIILIRLSC